MADTKLDWVQELDEENVRKLLDRDSRLIYEHCNINTLLDLLENLSGIQFYVSRRSLERIQQFYIASNFTGNNHKELAARLGCSESYVYKTLKELNKPEREGVKPALDLFQSS